MTQEEENLEAIIAMAEEGTEKLLAARLRDGDIEGSIFHANRWEQMKTALREQAKKDRQPKPIRLGWTL